MKKKFDIYEVVTQKFIDSLEKGNIPWKRPYSGRTIDNANLPYNFISKKHYKGINIMLLEMLPYSCKAYATFNQIKKLGGNVKTGEHGSMIVFWKFIEVKNKDEEKKDKKKKTIPFLKYFTVFNLEQTEGIEIPTVEIEEENEIESIDIAEEIIINSNTANMLFTGSAPSYSPALDIINLPKKEQFNSTEERYSTIFHEMVHSTGHESRLNREGISNFNGFGTETYSKEELVAEIGSSFLNHHCGFGDHEQENSEAYIKGWIKKLKDHKNLIISASGKAQKTTDYILNR